MMPQHLQLLDESLEALVEERVGSLNAFAWGVAELEFDEEALARGIVQPVRCLAVMPDGLLVRLGGARGTAFAQVSKEDVAARGEDVPVYLAVPSAVGRGSQTFVSTNGSPGSRYVEVAQEVSDAYGISEDTTVSCLRPNVQIMAGDGDLANYITLKLAELELGDGGTLRVSDRYVPPCLKIRASHALMRVSSKLVTDLSAVQRTVADRYRGRIGARVDFGAQDVRSLLFLQALSASLPRLIHTSAHGHVHPEWLHLELIMLAGKLSGLVFDDGPQNLPPYVHDRLADTLFPVIRRIERAIKELAPQRYVRISLEQPQRGLFVAKDLDLELLRGRKLFLAAQGEVEHASLARDLPTYVRVASSDQIANVVQSALPGLPVEVEVAPPTAIPVKDKQIYLRLNPVGDLWRSILSTRSLAIYQPIEPENVDLDLLAVES